jgi:hypothetical protein
VERPTRSQSSHCGPLHYWRIQRHYSLAQMQLIFIKPHLMHRAKLIALHLQYTGCMLQADEFKNVKFEITIPSEYRNSRRLGRLWCSSWEHNQCHHTKPWPSITPLFPGISGKSHQILTKESQENWKPHMQDRRKHLPVMTTSVKLYLFVKLWCLGPGRSSSWP